MMDLNLIWFVLVCVLLAGYAVLDGFDFGVGTLSLFARPGEERRQFLNAIGPVWDGNEVWLLTGGGALFAAFPPVYAMAMSGMYLAVTLLLVALIFRAVSLEFRGKVTAPSWRLAWDVSFGAGSVLAALLLGVAFGNVLQGLPIAPGGIWRGSFAGLLRPFPVMVGLLVLAAFTAHGAAYMMLKTADDLRERMRRSALIAWGVTLPLVVLCAWHVLFVAPLPAWPGSSVTTARWVVAGVTAVALAGFPVFIALRRAGPAFLSSALLILGHIALAALSLFPRLLPSSLVGGDLTAYNAASSPATLRVMLIIALVGMPLVIGYTIFIYRVFRGRVQIGPESY
jgi:cytochrome bd ubiquinol oxidase subunit II